MRSSIRLLPVHCLALAISLACSAFVHAQSAPAINGARNAANAPPLPNNQPRVRIGSGDLLEIGIYDAPEMTQTVRVNDVGNAVLSLIGSVHLEDLSIEEAQELLRQRYVSGHYLVDPHVTVLVREYFTQGVSVFGEVEHPGLFPVLGRRTLFDVLAEAGGITKFASNEISIKRAADSSIIQVTISGRTADALSSDIALAPGDKVMVPRAGIVYVIGEVNQPGGYVMQNDGHLSLLQIVAMALGTRNTASLDKTRLIRRSSTGYVETILPLKQILKGKQADYPLQAEDIVYVPDSVGKSILFHGVPGAVQAASSATIYRVM